MATADYQVDSEGFRRLMESITGQLPREAERSLWLNRAVAAEIIKDPDRALRMATENLDRMEARQIEGWGVNPWIQRWRRIIATGVDAALDVLASRDPEAIELRQNTPFAGVLDYREREKVLRAFARHWRQTHRPAEA
jgi:hypothetical protein